MCNMEIYRFESYITIVMNGFNEWHMTLMCLIFFCMSKFQRDAQVPCTIHDLTTSGSGYGWHESHSWKVSMHFKVHSAPSCLDWVRHCCCQLGHWKKKSTESTKDHQSRESCCCRWQNSRVGWDMFICNNFPVSLLWQKYHETCKSMTDSLTKMWKNVISSRTTIKLCTILPASESTFENIMQTHYLVAYWFEAKLKSLSSVQSKFKVTVWVGRRRKIPKAQDWYSWKVLE